MRYVYLDESVTDTTPPFIGYGALATDKNIDPTVVADALAALADDPDRHQADTVAMDDQTLRQGYFHASSDSKNAHSHLCRHISRRISGVCSCQFVKAESNREACEGLMQAAALSAVHAFDTREPIHMIFEARDDLTVKALKTWYEQLRQQVLLGVYESPWIPILFPRIEFELADKTNPGLQICDFLLWAVNRRANKDLRWVERVQTVMRTSATPQSGDWFETTFDLGRGIEDAPATYTLEDVPNLHDYEWRDLMAFSYGMAERVTNHYSQNGLPPCANHYEGNLRELALRKLDANDHDYIMKLAATYLLLFDLIPLVDSGLRTDDKRRLLATKAFWGLILRTDLVSAKVASQTLIKMRRRKRLSDAARLSDDK